MVNLILIFMLNVVYSLILFMILDFSLYLVGVYIFMYLILSIILYIVKRYKFNAKKINLRYLREYDIEVIIDGINVNEIYVDIGDNINIGSNLLALEYGALKALILHEKAHVINRDLMKIYIIKKYIFIELIISLVLLIIYSENLNQILILLLFLILKDILIVALTEKILSRSEINADLYVLSEGYKLGLLQALEHYIDLYKPGDGEEINLNYLKLIERYEYIKSTKSI